MFEKFKSSIPDPDSQKKIETKKTAAEKESKSLPSLLRKVFNTRIGRVLFLSLGLLMFAGDQRPSRIEIEKSFSREKSRVEFVLQNQSKLIFANWNQLSWDAVAEREQIDYSQQEFINRIIDMHDPILDDMGLYPITVSNPESFNRFIREQLRDPEILTALKLDNTENLKPKNIVELSVAIVAKNLSYSKDVKALEMTAREPVDKLLTESLPAECSNYAVATEAVFKTLKSDFFADKLKNVYVGTVTSSFLYGKPTHVFNKVTLITGPKTAEIAFIDPTAMDVDWGAEYLVRQDFLDLLHEWRDNGKIDNVEYVSLKYEYLLSRDLPSEQEWEFIRDDFFMRETDRVDENVLRFIKRFIKKTKNKDQRKAAAIIEKRLSGGV